MNASSEAVAGQRWDLIDVARGLAIAAMVVYHFSWDLSFLKLIKTEIAEEPAWQWFARTIAATFLVLVGLSLALAHAKILQRAAFLRRLAKVGAAALAVTLVTRAVFPDSYIFFGILHCIAAGSVLALPLLRAPWPVTALATAFCFAAPRLLTSRALDHSALDWLGLGSDVPITNDYVPLFPWFGLVLAGTLLGRALLSQRMPFALVRWRAENPVSRALAFAGRRSLAVYLLHQPILLGLAFGVLQVTGPDPVAERMPFMRRCTAGCLEVRDEPALCRAACDCTIERLKQDALWKGVLRNELAADERRRVSALAVQCLADRGRQER